jgi:hypothetical protein
MIITTNKVIACIAGLSVYSILCIISVFTLS